MSEEKREEPTAKAERRARERGQAWQSRDLTLSAVLLGAAFTLGLGRAALTPRLLAMLRAPFVAIESGEPPGAAAMAIVTDGASILAPFLVAIVALAALASAVQVGPLFAPRAVAADGARLDPSARFGELFGRKAAATFAMTLARLALSSLVVLVTLREALPGIATLSRQAPTLAFEACVSVVIALLFRVGLAMAALGTVDAVLERTLYRRSLRMSRREVLRERRESDGDEHVRRERERARSEIRDHDVELSVSAARMVVSDGELSVALSYDALDEDAVPRIAAIGRGLLADRILELAMENGVTCVTDESLAARLAIVSVGQPIPEELYQPVAERMHQEPADRPA